MSKFWLSHKTKDYGIHWRKWKLLCETKAQGGLGFRDLVAFNKALSKENMETSSKSSFPCWSNP